MATFRLPFLTLLRLLLHEPRHHRRPESAVCRQVYIWDGGAGSLGCGGLVYLTDRLRARTGSVGGEVHAERKGGYGRGSLVTLCGGSRGRGAGRGRQEKGQGLGILNSHRVMFC